MWLRPLLESRIANSYTVAVGESSSFVASGAVYTSWMDRSVNPEPTLDSPGRIHVQRVEHDDSGEVPSNVVAAAAASAIPPGVQLLCDGFVESVGVVGQLEIEFKDLSLAIPANNSKPSKVLLSGVTGKISPGTVTAIMGPSGAGKTTLLHMLLNKV